MPIILPPIVPAHGMTLQEMITQVSDEIRNVSINTKITRWLNMAIIELAGKYIFGTLHSYKSVVTSPSIPDVLLESDFYWLKTIEIPSLQRKLWPEDEQRLSESYPKYRTQTGTVSKYYLNGISLGLFMVPTSALTITYSYQRRPIKLVALDTYCDLPPDWHTLVTQKATTLGYSYEGNIEAKIASQRSEAVLLTNLARALYRRPDESLVAGSGNSGTGGKPAYPRLPSGY